MATKRAGSPPGHACGSTGHEKAMAMAMRRSTVQSKAGSRAGSKAARSPGLRGRTVRAAAVAAVAVVALAACTGDDAFDSGSEPESSGETALTVGGANFTEMLIMQQMYGQLLTKAGKTVTYKTAESREIYGKSLESGEIDVVPEYAATAAEYYNTAKNGPDSPAVSSADVNATVAALRTLAEEKGLAALDPAKAANQNGFAVTKAYADANQVTTLSQLAAKKKAIKLAAGDDCGNPERKFCKPGLESVYGFQITIDPLGFGTTQTKQAVLSGKDDVALVGTTDGTLQQLGLVLLADDKGLQAADNLVPLVNKASAGGTDVAEALNKLSAVLTTSDLAQLNLKVDGERQKPEDVAREYLTAKGLL